MKHFKKLVDDLTIKFDDYTRKYGSGLTCEFSTTSEDFEDKVDYISKKPVLNGYWHISKCGTCTGYKEGHHWHVQIVDAWNWEERHKHTNKLEKENLSMQRKTKEILEDIKGKEYYPKGTLSAFLDIFDCLIENPEQYPEYRDATLVADLTGRVHQRPLPEHVYSKCKKDLEELLAVDEDQPLWSVSRDVTVESDGSNRWNMFSECNQGCVAYVHLSHFHHVVGKRFRITVGSLPERKV